MSELFSFFEKCFFLCATVLFKVYPFYYIWSPFIAFFFCFVLLFGVVHFFNQCSIALFHITKIKQRFFFQKPTSEFLELFKGLALGFYDVEVKNNS